MSGEIDPVEYGRLAQQVEQLGKDVHEMRAMLKEMNDLMQQSKGGWKAIVMLSGIAGSVGAGIAWFIAHVWR